MNTSIVFEFAFTPVLPSCRKVSEAKISRTLGIPLPEQRQISQGVEIEGHGAGALRSGSCRTDHIVLGDTKWVKIQIIRSRIRKEVGESISGVWSTVVGSAWAWWQGISLFKSEHTVDRVILIFRARIELILSIGLHTEYIGGGTRGDCGVCGCIPKRAVSGRDL